jgi:hypothetical protein
MPIAATRFCRDQDRRRALQPLRGTSFMSQPKGDRYVNPQHAFCRRIRWPLWRPHTPMACVRLRPRASTSARCPVSPTTPSSATDSMLSRPLRRARRERRSVLCLFLHRVRVWFSQHRTRQVRSKSAGTATACSSARRKRSRTKFRANWRLRSHNRPTPTSSKKIRGEVQSR